MTISDARLERLIEDLDRYGNRLDSQDIDLLSALCELSKLRVVHRLAVELCDALDASEKDIGGHRLVLTILGELGPATEAVSQRPCQSPYCECEPGKCSHPGCYDARGLLTTVEGIEDPLPLLGLHRYNPSSMMPIGSAIALSYSPESLRKKALKLADAQDKCYAIVHSRVLGWASP